MALSDEKQLKMLKSQYEMYEHTKKETRQNMKDAVDSMGRKRFSEEDIKEHLAIIETAQADTVDRYVSLGGNLEDLTSATKKTTGKKKKGSLDLDLIKNMEEEKIAKKIQEKTDFGKALATETIEEKYIHTAAAGGNIAYDSVPLPSRGQCYKEKVAGIPVAYLTAYDENMIASPNLYKENKVIDYLLNEKILSDAIDPGDMLEGDREAIILWLRASGYGNDFPITVTDGKTGVEFDATVDLSKLKFKEFKLVGDERGWFDFELPASKDKVKFKFLTHNDIEMLEKLEMKENKKLIKAKLEEIVDNLDELIEEDEKLDNNGKIRTREAIRNIEKWSNVYEDEEELLYNHGVTNRLVLSIMSINGITDREYIYNYIRKMNVKDSSSLRKYITENEPGIDFNTTVQKPASLGGGSMDVFLQFDQFIFLNLA